MAVLREDLTLARVAALVSLLLLATLALWFRYVGRGDLGEPEEPGLVTPNASRRKATLP